MDARDLRNAFQFNDDASVYPCVDSVPAIQRDALVIQWKRKIGLDDQSPCAEFVNQTRRIRRFKKAWSKHAMDSYRSLADQTGHPVRFSIAQECHAVLKCKDRDRSDLFGKQ